MANTKGGLGTKGFNALFNDNEENVKVDIADDIQAQEIDITLIDRNPSQPRKTFDEDSLREMSTSIATYGVLQPLLLVKTDGGRYLIIAGERRFRASLLAGLKKCLQSFVNLLRNKSKKSRSSKTCTAKISTQSKRQRVCASLWTTTVLRKRKWQTASANLVRTSPTLFAFCNFPRKSRLW